MLETGNEQQCPKFNLTPSVTHPKHHDLLLMQILVHYVAGIPPPGTTVLYFNFKSGDIVWSSLTGCCMNLVAYISHECSSVANIDQICLFLPTKQSCWLYSQTRDQKTGSCCCRASEIGNKVLIEGELALVMKAESRRIDTDLFENALESWSLGSCECCWRTTHYPSAELARNQNICLDKSLQTCLFPNGFTGPEISL